MAVRRYSIPPAEEEESFQPDLRDQEILNAVQEAEKGKEGVEAEEKDVTNRNTNLEKIIILGCACCLLYLSQETHRSAFKLLRSLQDDIRSTNITQ